MLELRKLQNNIHNNLNKLAVDIANNNRKHKYVPRSVDIINTSDNATIPQNILIKIVYVNTILEATMRESQALLEAEKQERDAVDQLASPEDRDEKLKQIDRKFLQEREKLADKMHKEIAATKAEFQTMEHHENFTLEIDANMQALTDAVNIIVYPTAAIDASLVDLNDSEKKPYIVQKEGEVTHFKRPSKFFGSVEVCTMQYDKEGMVCFTFTSASGSDVNFIIEKIAQSCPNKRVILTCGRNYPNLEAVAEGLIAKGFKPEDIHLEFRDDKTGKIERTDYAKHKGLEGKALVAANKKAQQNATELADTKIAELGVLLKEANKADPVLGESSTPQQRLTALTREPTALQRDAKIKSLVAQPELALPIIAQAFTITNKPQDNHEIAIADMISQQILEQTPTGLLKTFTRLQEATNYRYDPTQAQSTDLAQAKSYLSVVAKGTIHSLDYNRNFVTLFRQNPILSSNTTIMKSAENYEQARAAFNQAHNLLMQTPTTANSATFWAHINQDSTTAQATNRIATGKAKAGDHDIVISALNKAAEENPQWKREIDQLTPVFSAHKKSLEDFNARKQEFQGLTGRCLDDLSHPELLSQMQASKISFTRRLAQNNPEKIAQVLFIAHEKGDEETRNSFAPLLAAIPVEEQESITKELLKIKGGADVLDQYSDSLKLHQPQISPLDTGMAPGT